MGGSKLLHEAGVLVEQGWCQGTEARDANGHAIAVDASGAESWSLLGALQAAAFADPSMELHTISGAVAALAELIVDPSLANWNDSQGRTKLDVLNVLKGAELLAFEQFSYLVFSES
jgi:hypothetical protein